MFATIVVVLPSQFTGGMAHLAHGGQSTVYDCSATSLHRTTVMAWYTDVTHEIKPITSGYRLALTYNLIHTTTTLRPVLWNSDMLSKRIRHILRAWMLDGGVSAPRKIIYLLEHKYSQANLRASALKGVDAYKVAILDPLAKELGFHLGFASVVCMLEGYGDQDYGRNEDDVDFAEVERSQMSLEAFVDLNGEKISDDLPLDEEEDTIPADQIGRAHV